MNGMVQSRSNGHMDTTIHNGSLAYASEFRTGSPKLALFRRMHMKTPIVWVLAVSTAFLGTLRLDDTGSFVTTLGRDTVAVERVSRAGNHISGDILVRVPATMRLHYDVEMRADGSIARTLYESDALGAENLAGRRLTLVFDGDSVRATIDSAGQKRNVVRPLPKGTVPMLMTGIGASYGLYSS